jgi:23S rRNA (cytidine1920-2'-O)/16S rRNA (cytidine1409-2'-O)-methyltransferase
MASKKRLDVLMTEQGLAESRQKAQAIIMAGQVFWQGKRMDKAGASVPEDAQLEVRGQTLRYVSRGGLKLEKAMATFDLPDLTGVVAIDAGASTGGFTDCMLQNGAAKVYAVDVGYGQLAWSLRNDPGWCAWSGRMSAISPRRSSPSLWTLAVWMYRLSPCGSSCPPCGGS